MSKLEDKPYYCSCGKAYKRKEGLHEHKRLKHRGVLPKGSYKFRRIGRPKITTYLIGIN